MRHVKTLATRITKKTYPIAVACLSPDFAAFPFDTVAGRWLIINRFYMEVMGNSAVWHTENLWLEESSFENAFKIVSENVVGPFHEVELTG